MLLSEACGSLSTLFETVATAGHGSFNIESLIPLVMAYHRFVVSQALEYELDGADGDALNSLDASALRKLTVAVEGAIADVERRAARLHSAPKFGLPRQYRELWTRQAFAANARAACADERAGSAERDSAQEARERYWYDGLSDDEA